MLLISRKDNRSIKQDHLFGVTVPQKAAFVTVINLNSELLLRDFRLVFSRCFLACFPPVPLLLPFYYSCFLLAGLSPLIYLLSCEKAIAQ